jgi:triosephosphate isomerase
MGTEPTVRQARQMLTEWAARQAAVAAQRNDVVRVAYDAGVSKMEIHRLTGIARNTIDGILAGCSDGPQTAPEGENLR